MDPSTLIYMVDPSTLAYMAVGLPVAWTALKKTQETIHGMYATERDAWLRERYPELLDEDFRN